MATVYKIHPGIGIARLGNSIDEFFIGPETVNGRGVEIDAAGAENAVQRYKDSGHRIKKQGARFRVLECQVDDVTRAERLVREVTPDIAQVTWTVQLANTKAAGPNILGGGGLRNPGVPTAQLSIVPSFPQISGPNQRVAEQTVGKFKGSDVSIGELRTDPIGRLIVLGGAGKSFSVPDGRPIGNFANNRDWCDDVSDGPIDADLRFPDGHTVRVQDGAWVIVAPPDFAPGVIGITTLYDVARDVAVKRGWATLPARPSYSLEILPILRRAAGLRFVNQFPVWNSYSRDWAALGDPQPSSLRSDTYEMLLDVEVSGVLNNFKFTGLQKAALKNWLDGIFDADFSNPPAQASNLGAELDRAALEQTVGGGFFPGIEAGILMTEPYLYSEQSRLTREPFVDGSQAGSPTVTLRAGALTERMACPWQADFLKCAGQWWPAQRPDDVFLKPSDAGPTRSWTAGITTHVDLAANFWKLGFVVPSTSPVGGDVHIETERDPNMPRVDV